MTDKKMWPMVDDQWGLTVKDIKTEVQKFAREFGLVITGEAFGENNKPHKFFLKGTFSSTAEARKWAKTHGFIVEKD